MAFPDRWPAPRRLDLSLPLPDEGVRVRLAVAFGSWPAIPWLVLGSNSANPLLHVYPDGLETRVIRKARHRYDDIVLAEAYAPLFARAPSMLRITWADARRQFLARPAMPSHLIAVLRLLADEGVPLGPEARALLEDSDPAAEAPRR